MGAPACTRSLSIRQWSPSGFMINPHENENIMEAPRAISHARDTASRNPRKSRIRTRFSETVNPRRTRGSARCRSSIYLSAVTALLVGTTTPTLVRAADGELDPSFGHAGPGTAWPRAEIAAK
jgi:hypothetical protein